MKALCPICRTPPGDGGLVCPTHGLYALPEKVLARLRKAPLLGLILNDRYALVGYIGGGGMGAVYLGLDMRLGRKVAIKLLKQAISGEPTDRKRFEVEARALSKLRSTNTVTIHDFGVVEEGVATPLAFMVMECVEGSDLGARIKKGPIAPDTVIDIVTQMGFSLDEAHGVDIVHRDIKPGNVLLTETPGGELLVKVVDFGIARMDGETPTLTGRIVGTPQYMAPEQCVASAHLDGRVDVYQTAVMTYEMLTGRRPFVSQNAIKILAMHMREPPPPLTGSNSDPVWAALEEVVHRGMAKEAAARHPTVGAFARALSDALGDVEDLDPLPPTVVLDPATLMLPKKRGGLWVMLAALLVVGVGGLGYWLGQPTEVSTRLSGGSDAGEPSPDASALMPSTGVEQNKILPKDAALSPPDAAGAVVDAKVPPDASAPKCGDGLCQSTENCSTCRADCGCKGGERCRLGKGDRRSEDARCVPRCGDGVCDLRRNENCRTCRADCRCKSGKICRRKTIPKGEDGCFLDI